MMRRPWQIWLVFGLCLAVVLSAMGWLTRKTIDADRAQWQSRQAALREEEIGSVLWRMDSELTTLLAQEAARPSFLYASFYTAPVAEAAEPPAKGAKGAPALPSILAQQRPSPLMLQPPPYVLLHFQITASGETTSPQAPADAALAGQYGMSEASLARSQKLLSQLASEMRYNQLASRLSSGHLPEVAMTHWQLNNANSAEQVASQQVVGNTLDVPQVQQQYAAAAEEPIPQQRAQLDGSLLRANNRSQSRAANDLQQRNLAYQSAAQRQIIEQRSSYNTGRAEVKLVREGISQPLWLGDRLLLARRVQADDSEVVQGCWFDWPKLRDDLVARHAFDFPGLTLQPVRHDAEHGSIKVSRLLATLPVQVVVPDVAVSPQPWSPLSIALVVAWSMLALTALAVALMLQSVMTLSERRGAFVSAVTHELRTPLTTFRMYAEMLAGNMVPSAERRQQYLETLRVEADRLSHLVENVLAYARLERGRQGQRRESVLLADVLHKASQRFADRCAQAGMQLVVEPSCQGAVTVRTDPSAVEQILFNLIDNACKYARDPRIHLSLATERGRGVVRVSDHGPGIDGKAARRLFQPFSKSVHDAACTAPGVGLGLALSRRLAHDLGGKLELETTASPGATFALHLPLDR